MEISLQKTLLMSLFKNTIMTKICAIFEDNLYIDFQKIYKLLRHEYSKQQIRENLIIMFKKNILIMETDEQTQKQYIHINHQQMFNLLFIPFIFEHIRKTHGDMSGLIVLFILTNYNMTYSQLLSETQNFLNLNQNNNANIKQQIETNFKALQDKEIIFGNQQNGNSQGEQLYTCNMQKIIANIRIEYFYKYFKDIAGTQVAEILKIILERSKLYQPCEVINFTESFDFKELQKLLIQKNPKFFQKSNFKQTIALIKRDFGQYFDIQDEESIRIKVGKILQNIKLEMLENDITSKFSKEHLRVFKGIFINENLSADDLDEFLLLKEGTVKQIILDLERYGVIGKTTNQYQYSGFYDKYLKDINLKYQKIMRNLMIRKQQNQKSALKGYEDFFLNKTKFQQAQNCIIEKILILNNFQFCSLTACNLKYGICR